MSTAYIECPDCHECWEEGATPTCRCRNAPASASTLREHGMARMEIIDRANERAGTRLLEPDKLTHGERAILNAAAELLALRSPAPTLKQARHCHWVDSDGGGLWETECRHAFEFNDGTPSENEAKFCCYCGGELVEVLYAPTESEGKE